MEFFVVYAKSQVLLICLPEAECSLTFSYIRVGELFSFMKCIFHVIPRCTFPLTTIFHFMAFFPLHEESTALNIEQCIECLLVDSIQFEEWEGGKDLLNTSVLRIIF